MSWLNRKTVFMNMLYTLIPWNLESIGRYEFMVKEKTILKLYRSEVKKYLVLISSEHGTYDSVLSVSEDKYKRIKKGEHIWPL